MNPYLTHANSLGALQTEMGDDCPTFLWLSETRKALPGGAKRRKDNSAGGFSLDADLTITCLVSQFGQAAATLREAMLNSRLTYLGQAYRIESVTVAAGGQQLRLECTAGVKV